jgi:hypothetical protein
MITLFVQENNPITPNFYNNLIINLQFHRLTCTCGLSGCLSVHGYYNRSVKVSDGKFVFRICRVKCSCCGCTHALLLSSMVPYSQISLQDHTAIITANEEGRFAVEVMDHTPSIDESNLHYIISSYLKHWKQRLLASRLKFSKKLSYSCFLVFNRQFMQIKSTPNILFLNTT